MNQALRRVSYYRCDLHPTDRLFYRGEYWIPREFDNNGHHVQSEKDPGRWHFIEHEELYRALESGESRTDDGYYTQEQTLVRARTGDLEIHEFSEKKRERARFMEQLVHYFEEECNSLGGKKPTWEELELLLITWAAEITKKTAQTHLLAKKSEKRGRKPKGAASQKKSPKAYGGTRAQVSIYTPPGPKRFLQLCERYWKCNRDVRALMPLHSGPGVMALTDGCKESLALAMKYAVQIATDRKAKKAKLFFEYGKAYEAENKKRSKETQLKKFGRFRFEKLIDRLFAADELMAAREGKGKARAYFRPQMYGHDVERPGERIEFDSMMLDVETWFRFWEIWEFLDGPTQNALKPLRIYIVAVVDAATGYILALKGTLTETSAAVIEALDMALHDKAHISKLVGAQTRWLSGGKFSSVWTDHGKPYTAEETELAFASYRISYNHPPAKQPWHRPFIERTIGMIQQDIAPNFDGLTFSDVVKRGDYDAEKQATLLTDEVIALILRTILDVYHHRIHYRLGMSRHEAWAKYVTETGIKPSFDRERRIHVFGTTEERTLLADGIHNYGIRFNSAWLANLRGKIGQTKVKIRYYKNYLLYGIVVKDPEGPGWKFVPSRARYTAHVSVFDWTIARLRLLEKARAGENATVDIMYAAMRDVASSSDAAAERALMLNAGFTPHMPSHQDLINIHATIFEGWLIDEDEPTTFDPSSAPMPKNPLREGGVSMPPIHRPSEPTLKTGEDIPDHGTATDYLETQETDNDDDEYYTR